MKKIKIAVIALLVGIVSVVGLTNVSAKSYSFIINAGTNIYASFTKYQCGDYTHSALNATSLSTSKISITTTLHKGSSVSGKTLGTHNHVYSSSSMNDEWNWGKTSTEILTVKSVNNTTGSSLQGRLYLNNGQKG